MTDQTKTEKNRYYEAAPQDIDVANFRKVIESRRSVRKFTDKAIPTEILDDCLDLALLAPNSSNSYEVSMCYYDVMYFVLTSLRVM